MSRLYKSIISWLKVLWSNKKKHNIDFVAIADNRVCISGRMDNFTAIKMNGVWSKGYPEFDDLMDNFKEVSDLATIKKYSLEARMAFNI